MSRKERKDITDFGKEVKIKLIELDKTQYWLTEEVNKKLGTSSDFTYINRVLRGGGQGGKVKQAICEILGISF